MSWQKEMAIRSSLGATPGMIFKQLLAENLLLAFLGGALGIALGYALLQGVLALVPRGTLPTEADLRINLPILGFAIAVTTLTGLLFGCVPGLVCLAGSILPSRSRRVAAPAPEVNAIACAGCWW